MTEIVTSPALPAPAPKPNPDTAEFWKAAGEGRFLLKRCDDCGQVHWYPRPICPFCHSVNTSWEEGSGKGTIYTYTVVRRAWGPWAEQVPYVIAYVELAEGPTIMTNIVDCDIDGIQIGDAVELVFHAAGDDTALPRFRPSGSRA